MKIVDIEPIIKKYKNNQYFSGCYYLREFDEGYDTGVLSVIMDLEKAPEIKIGE